MLETEVKDLGTTGKHPTTELHPVSQGDVSPQPRPSLVGSAERYLTDISVLTKCAS